ncbi:MAG: methylated-DNA--[protein]-cysteine S-methyltransferase [Rhodothermales bacterium]
MQVTLPPPDEMFRAFTARDAEYDGIFFTAVKTTGIFCRPTCPARKPAPENVEFFASPREAISYGYRPCKRCRPMEPAGETPEEIESVIRELEANPALRLRDGDLRARGLEPATVRRWFKKNHDMTFHAYQRGSRMARALRQLSDGTEVTETAFENGFESLSGFQEAIRRITGRSPSASRDTPVVHLSRILTPLGPMLAGATERAVCLLEFTDRRMLPTQIGRLEQRLRCTFLPGRTDILQGLESEMASYFAGDLRRFQVPVDTPGTPFQERVWDVLREIPYGQVRSYGDQARAIGDPAAVRAVARANGDNRVAIVIPCHRVIGSDGSLTGYGGGLWRKKYLLDLERGGDLFSTSDRSRI